MLSQMIFFLYLYTVNAVCVLLKYYSFYNYRQNKSYLVVREEVSQKSRIFRRDAPCLLIPSGSFSTSAGESFILSGIQLHQVL